MTSVDRPQRAEITRLPENFAGVQPGGGRCYAIELSWGRLRRWWLRRFRPTYVQRMAACRRGDPAGAPHEILDPRDLKYCRNLCTCDWAAEDDPFDYRNRLPLTRWGLAEVQIIGLPLLAATALLAWFFWPAAIVPAVLLGLFVSFFRDPRRTIPTEPGLVVAPADGRVAEITRLEHDAFIGGPAVRIGIFLSIFNVHLNRSPVRARVVELRYNPGEFLNALRAESALRNENTWIGLEEEDPPHRKLIVRQISGAIARRIVCAVRPGEVFERGHKIGMIKLGSRTELILPDTDGLAIAVAVGDRVKAGSTVVAEWPTIHGRPGR